MVGFGLLLLGLGLLGVGLFAHKRRFGWVGFALGVLAGLLLVVSPPAAWLSARSNPWPAVCLVLLLALGIGIGADLRDKRPDKMAIIGAAFVPMLLVVSLAQVPTIGDSVAQGWSKTSTAVSTQMGGGGTPPNPAQRGR